MNELTPESLDCALSRAERQSEVAAGLIDAVSNPVDRAFLGHLIGAR